jgi:hypothetical protein
MMQCVLFSGFGFSMATGKEMHDKKLEERKLEREVFCNIGPF